MKIYKSYLDTKEQKAINVPYKMTKTSVVLSNSKVAVNTIKESVLPEGKNVEVLTMQSIKGL